MQDPIVMKKDDDNRSELLKVSCHTKFRFAEREAQCILGECGPLRKNKRSLAPSRTQLFSIVLLPFMTRDYFKQSFLT